MAGPIPSFKWTTLFYLLLISICCSFGHGAVLGRTPVESTQQCDEYEGAACPEELGCVKGRESE